MSSQFINSFNVGTDLSLTIVNNQTGAIVRLDGKKTDYDPSDKSKLIESTPIDNGGVPDHRVVYGGWQGTITVDKASGDFERLYAFMEAQYYLGAPQSYFTVIETQRSPVPGGASLRFQYTNVVFHQYKSGPWAKETKTQAKCEFAAAMKVDLNAF